MLGLTQKQIQNVLRSDDAAWEQYVATFEKDIRDLAQTAEETYGPTASGDWLWTLYLLSAIGSQTLTTRGSEKSLYGKFFEKLVLGAVLHLLGLRLVEEDDVSSANVFWLSSRGRKRESDATALFGKGVGIRFDIGFIGTGSTEISLDKVSRFERQVDLAGKPHHLHTFVIVDKIGPGSRITVQAEKIDGEILQMSSGCWPRDLAKKIQERIPGFTSPVIGATDIEARNAIERTVASAQFETTCASWRTRALRRPPQSTSWRRRRQLLACRHRGKEVVRLVRRFKTGEWRCSRVGANPWTHGESLQPALG